MAGTKNVATISLPVSVGMEMLRSVTALYQNGYINCGEKDFMTEQIQSGLHTGDYFPLYRYVLVKLPAATEEKAFLENMKNLMEQEE